MTIIGIRARFPLGIYRGHRPDGQRDLLPSPLRLHAALVAAAGNGSTASEDAGVLRRNAEASRALEWLEDNPPDYVELPDWEANADRQRATFAYRDEGVFEKVPKSPIRRKTARVVADATALSGPIGWGWKSVPDAVRASLESLCADVPCLGEADSPVILEVDAIAPTHQRASSQNPFASVAIRLPVPGPGRTEELDVDYEKAQPAKAPTVSADKWTASEQPAPPRVSHVQKLELGYDEIAPSGSGPREAPWRHVVHFPIDREIGLDERVLWSVTMHRALVAALADDATPIVTGKYAPRAERPANRIAIQPLPGAVMEASEHGALGEGIALLLPEGGLEAVASVLASLKRLYRGARGGIGLGKPAIFDAGSFWRTPERGMTRLWTAVPAVVPETRRQRNRGSRAWTLADSALLSVGFTYRDALGEVSVDHANVTARYVATILRVEQERVRVLNTSLIADSDTTKYVHKLPAGVVAQPYRLTLGPGALISDTALVAIGQTRHLGGGLLCPVDVPAVVAEAMGYQR